MSDMDATPSHFAAKAAIARHYGVHRHTVDQWDEKGLLGKRGRHGYHRATVCENVDRFLSEKPAAGDRDEKTRLECERLRVVIARERELVEQARIETQRISHALMPVTDHMRAMEEVRALYLGGLDQLTESVATKLRDVHARQVLAEAVDALRAHIAGMVNA